MRLKKGFLLVRKFLMPGRKQISNYAVRMAITFYLQPGMTWDRVQSELEKRGHKHYVSSIKRRVILTGEIRLKDGFARCPFCKKEHRAHYVNAVCKSRSCRQQPRPQHKHWDRKRKTLSSSSKQYAKMKWS